MTTGEIREKFLTFFNNRNHKILDSAPLVTSDEKGVTNSTLFNSAGVQPLIPYILGERHPSGNRLASAQKCVRTIDIDEVGDNTHLTFFEMLGNWSLGDYFKSEAIEWSYTFLTDKNQGLGLDPNRLYVTVFEGDENAPRDDEAYQIWQKFMPKNRIYFKSAKSNWWAAGDNGPCGPDTEMFYDVTGTLGDLTPEEFDIADSKQQIVEVWNNVFMQFDKKDGKIIGKLEKFAVDTGAGLERLTAVINNKKSVYETDTFLEIIEEIKNNSTNYNEKSARIIADHVKTACFLISDGVISSNTDRGYILRRLIRRSIRHSDIIKLPENFSAKISEIVIAKYSDYYKNLKNVEIARNLLDEELKFRKTLKFGIKEFEKILHKSSGKISGKDAFTLFSSFGFPIELTIELAAEKNTLVELDEFNIELKQHQDLSRTGAEQKFKGGLMGQSEIEKRYHTATHLLHQALRDVLGSSVSQRGSNINTERLRFDFSYDQKMTDEQKQSVEKIVNEKIQQSLPVNFVSMSRTDAEKTGALHFFADKYGDTVSVYYIGDDINAAYSKEFCGGPHVKNTSELGKFKIQKEEAVSAGVRRIKAILE